MKKSHFLVLALALLFSGCSSDSKNNSDNLNELEEEKIEISKPKDIKIEEEKTDNGFRVENSIYKFASDFEFTDYEIERDTDDDGIKEIADIVKSAQEYINKNPRYYSSYHQGGYPPDGIGVCTDVIWNALDGAGYNFKKLVDSDIASYTSDYPNAKNPDPNIDFRRVKNLHVFFKKYTTSLTTELENPEDWMPGDVIIYKNDKHISICSDKRNEKGFPWIIHNAGQYNLEEDNIRWSEIIGHFRIDEFGLNTN